MFSVENGQRPAICLVGFQIYPGHPQVRRDAEALVEMGCDVTVVVRGEPGQAPRESLGRIEVHRLSVDHQRGSWPRYAWEYLRFLAFAFVTVSALHFRKRFRVVEVLNMPDFLVLTALVPRLTGARVILYILDNMPEIMAVSRKLRRRHPVVRLLALQERMSAAFADRVIVTQEMARRVVESRGVSPEKISVVLNCPDDRVFTGRSAEARTRQDSAFEILTHGTILERWGNQVLIEALPIIAEEIPDVRVRIIGRGQYLPVLQALADEKGVSDRVHFHNWVPVEELPGYIVGADVGYVGVLFGMALSNKLLEYAALRLPIVVTKWSTHEHYFPSDAVTYFRAGDAEELASAVLKVYREPEQARQRSARAATLYRQRYCWAVQKQVYLGIYADLLNSARMSR